MRRIRIKPSKEVSVVGLVAGLGMVALGVVWAIPTFGAFGVVWSVMALAIAGYHAANIFSGKGVASQEIDFGDPDSLAAGDDVGERLRRLDALRQKGLISEAEYRQKRAEIIGQL